VEFYEVFVVSNSMALRAPKQRDAQLLQLLARALQRARLGHFIDLRNPKARVTAYPYRQLVAGFVHLTGQAVRPQRDCLHASEVLGVPAADRRRSPPPPTMSPSEILPHCDADGALYQAWEPWQATMLVAPGHATPLGVKRLHHDVCNDDLAV
jgi:hypothetical protein